MSTRTRGGRQPVPIVLDDVTAAALGLVERHGLSALTLKAVADELGITSPAVYYYVRGKDELVERVCERVAASVSLEVDAGLSWQAQVTQIVVAMHRTFLRYPGVGVRVLSITGPPAPAANRINQRVVGIVRDAGFGEAEARRLDETLHLLFSGWLLRTAFPRTPLQEADLQEAVALVLAGFAAQRARG